MHSSAPASSDSRVQLAQLSRRAEKLSARNEKLAELLAASRAQLEAMKAQVAASQTPPSTYGTFLELAPDGSCAEIFTSGRQMRVAVSSSVERTMLRAGDTVRLGDNNEIVEIADIAATGKLGTLAAVLGDNRAIVTDENGSDHVVRLGRLLMQPHAGDSVIVDFSARVALEVIPRADVTNLYLEETPDLSFADIGGLETEIENIRDSVELPFTHPELYREYGLKAPKGVLLFGPPGCGKTLIAKAVAHSLSEQSGEQKSHFINVKGPELLNKFVGETERSIRVIFERARELGAQGQPVVVFFDEMESLFRTRGSGVSSDMETTVVPQLLAELDGVEEMDNVIVIGATNREDLIDPAVLRPGRLDVKIRIGRPNKTAARDILAHHLNSELPLEDDREELIDAVVDKLFMDSPYVELTLHSGEKVTLHHRDVLSGALIANIVNRAKKNAIKDRLAGKATGIVLRHLLAATTAENDALDAMIDTTNPEAWATIMGNGNVGIKTVRALNTHRSTP